MVNSLIDISVKDLSQLRDKFRVSWPSHIRSFNVLDNYINWFNKDPIICDEVKIYSLNGDWSDGSYIIIDDYQIIFDTLDVYNDRLYEMLQILPIKSGFEFQCFEDRLCPIVDRMFESRKLVNVLQGGSSADCLILSKSSADCLELNVLPGFKLKPLSKCHADMVNNAWRYKTDKSLRFIQNIIKFNASLGLFNSENTLIGWILMQNDGSIGILYVKEEYRRRGLAKVLVKTISKVIHDQGRETWACTMEYNIASKNLLLSIGFEVHGKVHWRYI